VLARRLVQAGIAAEVKLESAADQKFDVVVSLGGDEWPLEELVGKLTQGGSLYAEVDRTRRGAPSPAASKRTLVRAGFGDVQLYWAWPRLDSRRIYLPIDAPQALSWFLNSIYSAPNSRRRLAGWVLRLAARIWDGIPSALVRGYAVTASRAPSPAAASIVTATRPATGDHSGSRPLLIANSNDELGRVVVLLMPLAGGEPSHVAKLARLPDRNWLCEREFQALTRLRSSIGTELAATIPRPVALLEAGGLSISVEEFIPGRAIGAFGDGAPGRRSGNAVDDLEAAAEWLARFHRDAPAGRIEWSAGSSSEWLDEPFARFSSLVSPSVELSRLVERARRSADSIEGITIPLVWQHYAYGPWNVFRNRSEVGVIDWEDASPGLPLVDLIYFVIRWYEHFTRVRGRHERVAAFESLFCESRAGGPLVAAARKVVAEYLVRLGIRGEFEIIALTAFLLARATSRAERSRRLAEDHRGSVYEDYLQALGAHSGRALADAVPGANE
jgi:hypothetical protein